MVTTRGKAKRPAARKPATKKPATKKPATKKAATKQRAGYDPRRERAALEALEKRLEAVPADPFEIAKLARELSQLSNDIAMTIYRLVSRPGPDQEIWPLVDLMNRAAASSVASSAIEARRFVELGSPKRAIHTLFESFRVAGDSSLPAAADQLASLLDAHAPAYAGELRELVAAWNADWADEDRRGDAKQTFLQGTQRIRDALDWNALPDAIGRL